MIRGTWIYIDGKLILKGSADDTRPRVSRSNFPSPYVVSDALPDLRSMADGKIYDSKSAMRREYKRRGLIELGNDAPTHTPEPRENLVTENDVYEAYQKVSQGYKPDLPNKPDDLLVDNQTSA